MTKRIEGNYLEVGKAYTLPNGIVVIYRGLIAGSGQSWIWTFESVDGIPLDCVPAGGTFRLQYDGRGLEVSR